MASQPEISDGNRKYVSPSFAGSSDPFYSTINAAVAAILFGDGPYPSSPWAIYIYPGVYQESVALASNISLIGSGIEDVTVKGTISGPASDAGPGQCYICNVSIDGNGQSALIFGDSGNAKSNFLVNVKIFTTVLTASYGLTLGRSQVLRCFQLACLGFPNPNPPPQTILFGKGIRVTDTGNLRMWHSTINSDSYCIEHEGSQYSECYSSLLGSNSSSFHITDGVANFYNCTTVGQILAEFGARVKHVNSFHDGHFTARNGATMWVSGMKWGEWLDNPSGPHNIDVMFALSGQHPVSGIPSKVIVSNSRAGAQVADPIVSVGAGCIFKAFNSEFNNIGVGQTIYGETGALVYLYNCVLNKPVQNVTVPDFDANNVLSDYSQ